MPTTIAVIADFHLPTAENTAQEAALDWALAYLGQERPDLVILAGDLTATGAAGPARTVRDKLEASGLPFRAVSGNSDWRTPDTREQVHDLLTVNEPFLNAECAVLVADAAETGFPARERERVKRFFAGQAGRQRVMAVHPYPDSLADDERAWLLGLLERGEIDVLICAHKHERHQHRVGNGELHLVRGLDPDKARAGPPSLALFDLRDGRWSRREIAFPDGVVSGWSVAARREFVDLLGFSCMQDSLGGLAQARLCRAPVVELRAAQALTVATPELERRVRRWRAAGGACLSVHMPNLAWVEPERRVDGLPAWREALALALRLGADRAVLHPPRALAARMGPGQEAWTAMTEALVEALGPALETELTFGVENLHTRRGDDARGTRGFGCLPHECRQWIRHLRAATGCGRIGLHLDIGHARNNPPHSSFFTLGQWYAEMGAEATGYHLHQVGPGKTGGPANHLPIDCVFGPFISLSSFFWAWQKGQLRHGPMVLEIREPAKGWATLASLRNYVMTACADS